MLIAILNCCTKEELEEEEDEDEDPLVEANTPDSVMDPEERRRSVIKEKILAVGRMSRVFGLMREEAESGSELKSIEGSAPPLTDTLIDGADQVKGAIKGFGQARTSDIENERLPPDMIEADEDAPASPSRSAPTSPSEPASPISFATDPFSSATSASNPSPVTDSPHGSPSSVGSPLGSPGAGGQAPWRRGHARQQSLGTTSTSSPSTRRRSLESTISLIKEVVDGGEGGSGDSAEMREMADVLSSPTRSRVSPVSEPSADSRKKALTDFYAAFHYRLRASLRLRASVTSSQSRTATTRPALCTDLLSRLFSPSSSRPGRTLYYQRPLVCLVLPSILHGLPLSVL